MCASALSAKLSRSSASPCLNSLNASVSVMSTSSAFPAELVAGMLESLSRGTLGARYFHDVKVSQEIRRKLDRHAAKKPTDTRFYKEGPEERCDMFYHTR